MIEVLYSCDKCGLKKISVPIVERGADEDIVEFVMRAGSVCAADHNARSPGCAIAVLAELYVPTEDGQPIGNVRKH